MAARFPTILKKRLRAEIAIVRQAFSDLIFPPFCPICEQQLSHNEHLVCEDCFESIHTIESRFCRRCAAPLEEERKTCRYCKDKKYHFTKVRALGTFSPPLSEMVHLLKYERKTHLANRLGILLANIFLADHELSSSSIIIPVPLHPTRMRERGYNQSLLLAKKVAEISRTELCTHAISRAKPTKSQTALAHTQRIDNLRNAFRIEDSEPLAGKSVTVVDDVLTSGTTLDEMAKTLLDAGAELIYGLVLARAMGSDPTF
jgi:ComF family protein